MSELVPSLVPLDKGLNLQTAKLVAPAGSVLDSLNYEQVDFQGQKRIDGFARYDGSLLSTIDEFYRITLATPFSGDVANFVSKFPSDGNETEYATGDGFFGIVVGKTSTYIDVAVINYNELPEVGDFVFPGAETLATDTEVTAVAAGVDTGITVDEHYDLLLQYNAVLRSNVEELPGSIIGLHWFRDRLYAVADVTTVSLDGVTPVIYPNDVLTLDGVDAKVLDSYVRGNTRVVFLDSMTPADWAVEGATVTREGDPMGAIANGFETLTASEEIASLFESRSEQQVLEEDAPGPFDYGWRFVDQGWEVLFTNGESLYGSLPSLNQNISGLGIQGPTSVAGNNGRPQVLVQKVSIDGEGNSVNGWKSSQSPNSYALESDNLIDVDGDTIYADAFISWDGDTGEVVGFTDTLVEYPATNTVEIDQ